MKVWYFISEGIQYLQAVQIPKPLLNLISLQSKSFENSNTYDCFYTIKAL